jgi:YfiH family protein
MLQRTQKDFYVLEKLSKIDGLLHGFSTIDFGNMSYNHGQKKEVLRNRRRFSQAVGVDPKTLVSVNQVHGKKILIVKGRAGLDQREEVDADGLITKRKKIGLLIKMADCLSLLLFNPKKETIGLIHAGWKGVSLKIHLEAIEKMKQNFGCQPANIWVGIGPAICAQCYDKIDLVGQVMSDFQKAGLKKEKIEGAGVCTFENQDFYSHQRSKMKGGPKGRFATLLSWS